jgi:non-specific serine/threonine protein kinase
VRTFQEDERVPFFVLSLKAGGSGLTLTAASHVAHFDRWWIPAVENQATDRAFRIVQKAQRARAQIRLPWHNRRASRRLDRLEATDGGRIAGGGGEINLTELGDSELLDLVQLDLDAATKEA